MKALLIISLMLISPQNREETYIVHVINNKNRIEEHNKLLKQINDSLRNITTSDGLPSKDRKILYKKMAEIHHQWGDEFTQLADMN